MTDHLWLAVATLALAVPLGTTRAAGLTRPASADTIVTCAPSRPAIAPTDTVTLRVFGDPPLGADHTVTWSVSAGRVLGRGATVRWLLSDAGVGRFTAEARVTRRRRLVGSCSVEVALTPPGGDMGGLLPAGVFLENGTSEALGYGAYTYLLLGAPPSPERRSRYRAAIARYLQVAQDIASYDARLPRARLNVNYLPVDAPLVWSRDSVLADSVLAHYQYATAQTLLARFDGAHLGGPYLVTVPAPLSTTQPVQGRFVFHDLAPVTVDRLVPAWVDVYLAQSTQQQWNDPGAWALFPLRLRTAIGSVALGIPPVKAAMKDWSGWLESWSSVATEVDARVPSTGGPGTRPP